MALTEHDKKTLSKSDQQKITAATNAWNAANAKGDTAGMAKAAADAAAVRNNAGYKTDSSGNYSGSYSPTSSGGGIDYSILGQQQMANGANWQDVQTTMDNRLNKALNTPGLEQYAYDDKYWQMYKYIQDQKNASGATMGDIAGWNDEYNQNNKKPTTPERDPRIDALLNQILNRDAFSYDVASDPLYRQYANMYQREGDRAMKETLAEAAAGAGGMNTYAITAAQQANSYYNSQLNDRIPELYQLAYNMYLQDIEGQVRDLGLLESMDATQYSRYRDTMNDWYNDKNFAYGTYQDAVQQGNWQTTFDNNEYWKNKEWNYNDMWKNKEWDYNDMWANKEWDYNDEWKNKEWDYNTSVYDSETAYNKVMELIDNGATTIDPELIKQAGITETAVNQMVEAKKKEIANQYASSSSGGGGSYTTKLTSAGNYSNSNSNSNSKPTLTAAQARDAINSGVISQQVIDAYNYYYGTNYTLDDVASDTSATTNDTSKPTLTAAQARDALESGIKTQAVIDAYNYYYGTNYTLDGNIASDYNPTQDAVKGKDNGGGGYDNGSLSTTQVKQLQEKLGVAADGYWGSNSKNAAGGLSADAAWEKYFGNSESVGIGEGIRSSNVLSLGIGTISNEMLLNLVKSGAVILNADGTVQWANGYNKDNYQRALNKLYTGIFPTL